MAQITLNNLIFQWDKEELFEKFNVRVLSVDENSYDGMVKLNCEVIQRKSKDYILRTCEINDVAVQYIINIYTRANDLWETSRNYPKYLFDLYNFKVELICVKAVSIKKVYGMVPAALDPHTIYANECEAKFDKELFRYVKVWLDR